MKHVRSAALLAVTLLEACSFEPPVHPSEGPGAGEIAFFPDSGAPDEPELTHPVGADAGDDRHRPNDGGPERGDETDRDADAGMDELPPVPHLSADVAVFGSSGLELTNAEINTDTLKIDGADPSVPFQAVSQLRPGPQVAVLSVDTFRITAQGKVRVIGSRPLVILAKREVVIAGVLDAGGRRGVPGAGGEFESNGAGGNGTTPILGSVADVGGGGAGSGTPGAAGGGTTQLGTEPGAAGASYLPSDIPSLLGGARGGRGSLGDCTFPVGGGVGGTGGAGGGAIQIASKTSIVISGGIDVGGGGGSGGAGCTGVTVMRGGGGAGGGSGGVIDLLAPLVSISPEGYLVANGGGGGSGANGSQNGDPGKDGGATRMRTPGGAAQGMVGLPGGAGGARDGAPKPGETANNNGNSGGGGGAAGRIRIIATRSYDQDGLISPAPED